MLLKQAAKPRRKPKLRIPRSAFPSLAHPAPRYKPNPMSLLPLPRCFRSNCRAVKKDERSPCALCGSLATNSAPLVTYTVFIEEF
jgi:hypothetical protein